MTSQRLPESPAEAPLRRLLNYRALATYLSISLRATKELAASGEIPKVRIGHRVLFDLRDVDAYIDRRHV